jgi:hypothetical protein
MSSNTNLLHKLLHLITPSQGTSEFTVIALACGVVLLPVVIWACFFRKPANPHSARVLTERVVSRSGARRRRRRSRRNPTLAETGGMPRLKPEPSPERESALQS